MKLSKSNYYLAYGHALAKDAFEEAQSNLLLLIDEVDRFGSVEQKSFVLKCLGDVTFFKGNEKEAISYYEESLKLMPNCILTKLFYAEFLCEKI